MADSIKSKRKHTRSEIGSEHGSNYFNGISSDDEEHLYKLKFPKGASIYDQMRRADPTVVAVLLSVFNPIKSATWAVEPASESAKDKEIAEFISKNLFPEEDKGNEPSEHNKSWEETLHEILLYIPFGYSVMEKVYTYFDGKVWLKKLSARLPRTIKEFNYKPNTNTFDHAIQYVNSTRIELPAKRIIVFTANKEGATLSGISFLRSAYKPWSIKTDVQKIQASTVERYGLGTPMATLPEGKSDKDPEGEAAIEALENLSSNEQSYLLLPFETTVTMLGGGSKSMPEMQSVINYCDQQITLSFLAQFLNLGVSSFGSRALGNTFVDFFTNSLEGTGDYISSRINQDLIQELVDLNYDTDVYPKLVMSRIDSVDMDNIAILSDAGLISSTFETENKLRRVFRLPPITEEEYEKAKNPVDPMDNGESKTTDDKSSNNPDSKTDGKGKRGNNPKGKGSNGSTLNKKDAKKQLHDNIVNRIMLRTRKILRRRGNLEN